MKFRRVRVSRPLFHPLHTLLQHLTASPCGLDHARIQISQIGWKEPTIAQGPRGKQKKEKDKEGHEVLLSRNTEAVRNSEHILSLDGDVILRRQKNPKWIAQVSTGAVIWHSGTTMVVPPDCGREFGA